MGESRLLRFSHKIKGEKVTLKPQDIERAAETDRLKAEHAARGFNGWQPQPLGSDALTEKDPAMRLVFQERKRKEREARRLEREARQAERAAKKKATRTKHHSVPPSVSITWGISPELDAYMSRMEALLQATLINDDGQTAVGQKPWEELDPNLDIKRVDDARYFPIFKSDGFDLISYIESNPALLSMLAATNSSFSKEGKQPHILRADDPRANYRFHPDYPWCIRASASWDYSTACLVGEERFSNTKGRGRSSVLTRKDGFNEAVFKVVRCTPDGGVVRSITADNQKIPTREGDIWRLREILILAV